MMTNESNVASQKLVAINDGGDLGLGQKSYTRSRIIKQSIPRCECLS